MSAAILDRLADARFALSYGAIISMGRDHLAADGPAAHVGDYCSVATVDGGQVLAEVVSVDRRGLRLSPLGATDGVALGAQVVAVRKADEVPAGNGFAGRAIDAHGQPIDGKGAISAVRAWRPRRAAALDRVVPKARFVTGLRAIDGLLPLGQGQRVGIFAASGVGKTSLMEQLLRHAAFDRAVLCLVGERGREVSQLWDTVQRSDAAAKIALVAATADESASVRARALDQALALAAYWRAEGDHVLLLVDSVTRVAAALRELGLATGEPPTMRGFTPNVFSALPRYAERCGALRSGGAITAIMTVLSETDDVDDPIVELMKSILDGHIVLSRSLAERRHFPAIDLARSVSRLGDDLSSPAVLANASTMLRLHAVYEDARPMIESGLYTAGSSAEIDAALAAKQSIGQFLRQDRGAPSLIEHTFAAMAEIAGAVHHAA